MIFLMPYQCPHWLNYNFTINSSSVSFWLYLVMLPVIVCSTFESTEYVSEMKCTVQSEGRVFSVNSLAAHSHNCSKWVTALWAIWGIVMRLREPERRLIYICFLYILEAPNTFIMVKRTTKVSLRYNLLARKIFLYLIQNCLKKKQKWESEKILLLKVMCVCNWFEIFTST